MAKIKWSALVSGVSNSLNGSTMFKGRYGSVIRNKVKPVNPQSSAQTLVRATFSQFSQGWRALTENQRSGWRAATVDYMRTDGFGDMQKLTGNTLFISLNTNLATCGIAQLSAPFAPQGVERNDLSTIGVDSATFIMNFIGDSIVPVGSSMVIEATPCVSAGKLNLKNQFRIINVFSAGQDAAVNIIAEYTAKFGVPVAGTAVQARVKFINITTGEVTPVQMARTIVE